MIEITHKLVEITRTNGCCGTTGLLLAARDEGTTYGQVGDSVCQKYTCSGHDYTIHMTIRDIVYETVTISGITFTRPKRYTCIVNDVTVGNVSRKAVGLSDDDGYGGYASMGYDMDYATDDDDDEDEDDDDDSPPIYRPIDANYVDRINIYRDNLYRRYPIGTILTYDR